MSYELQDYFENKENCQRDILAARSAMINTNTTEDQFDQIQKTLGIMYLHCPIDMQNIVHATLMESLARREYFELLWSQEEIKLNR